MLVDPLSSFEAAKQGIGEISSVGVSEGSESVVRAERARTSNNVPDAAREMSVALREQLRGYVTKFHADVW